MTKIILSLVFFTI